MELDGKVSIVTGGAGNIGSASSRRLAAQGSAVVVVDRPGTPIRDIVGEIIESGGRAIGLEGDVSQEDHVVRIVAATIAEFGRLDMVANVAARLGDNDIVLDNMGVELWDHMMAVNVRGSMLMCKHAIPAMLEHVGGSIINFTSTAAVFGDLTRIAYSTSKAALAGFTRAVATAYGKAGIRCNSIAPGNVWPDERRAMLGAAWVDIAERTRLTPRAGIPEDIAHLLVYLASDKSRYITGQNIFVDGGGTVHQPWVGVR